MRTETLIKTLSDGLYRLACGSIRILALLFTGLLFVSGFLFTCYADDMVSQRVLTAVDNPLLQILGAGLGISILLLLLRPLVNTNPKRSKRIVQLCVFGWIMLLGGILVLFGRTAPAADAWSVYSAAESMALGDTSVIHPTDSYLSYYPQQVGLMAFFELIIRLWKLLPTDLHAYHFIKCLYVVLTCVIVYYQSLCVQLLWEDERIDCVYLILAGGNLPLIMYSSFVYGEIPSFASLSIGLYYLLKILKSPDAPTGVQDIQAKKRNFVISAAVSLTALTLSVMLRKNSLVIIIAVVLVTLLEGILTGQRGRRYGLFLFALLCVICSLSILPATQRFYERRAGSTLKSGVPAMAYFAMGMQESSRGNGWYNGFNFDTYQETGMDTAATVALSRKYIAERAEYFRGHLDAAAGFYWGKYLSQWADGTYASRQATLATFGGRLPAVESVYSGECSRLYIGYCNIYQNIIYLGSLLCVILTLPRREKRPAYKEPSEENAVKDNPSPNLRQPLYMWLGVIGALGGFLFHMLWEANARYIFLYSLLLLPYAARGIVSSTSFLEGFRKNNTAR
ncbi:MAG: hypothetical protein NC092_04000 [Butyrivibrio sp.]|nr:hypothetical protein [Muribaculum sp.]MCM1551837.1 hypothetical protein [Butyrivibrio sp.]